MTSKQHGSKWTVEEERQLHTEVAQHMKIDEIANAHGRTLSAIVTRMRQLHLYPTADKETQTQPSLETTMVDMKKNEYNTPVTKSDCNSLICVIDTETTGKDVPLYHVSNSEKWQAIRLVQFAYELYHTDGTCIEKKCMIIQPDGFIIPTDVVAIHGITNERAATEGIPIQSWFSLLEQLLPRVQIIVAHNIEYDANVILSEMYRYRQDHLIKQWQLTDQHCTMLMGKRLVKKWAKLSVLAEFCSIPVPTVGLHNADVDTHLCAQIYFYLRNKHISNKKHIFPITMEDRDLFKLLGGRWDHVHKVWTMDEAEPFFRYAKKWLL